MKFMTFIILGVISLYFVGCSIDRSENKDLPVLDLSKEYPKEKLDIREIADIEYIPLETTDESVLGMGLVSMSDEYIIINYFGNIFFFDRKTGKFLWKFNRKGGSGEEYSTGIILIVDFLSEECYVYDCVRNKILVYTYHGDFKRSFPIKKEGLLLIPTYNYNKDYLVGYNKFTSRSDFKLLDPHPYYLISKRDGKISPLPIDVENSINTKLERKFVKGGTYSISLSEMINLLKAGDETFIGDFALDTLYISKEHKLTPVAVQKPEVFSSDVPLVVSADLFTDSYMGFYVVKMRYVPEDPYKPLNEAPYLYWNRKTGEIHRYELYDSNILTEKILRPRMSHTQLDKNQAIFRFKAEFLVEQYEAGKLRGELKEIASKLSIEDNHVLVLCKFK